jgi:hypothetical protein
MEASTMFGTEVAFEGGPWCRGLAGWLLVRLGPGRRNVGLFGPLRLANCRAEAEEPATAVPGGPGRKGRRSMLRVDSIVCGANYYAESAAVIGGPPPKTCGFRFT